MARCSICGGSGTTWGSPSRTLRHDDARRDRDHKFSERAARAPSDAQQDTLEAAHEAEFGPLVHRAQHAPECYACHGPADGLEKV